MNNKPVAWINLDRFKDEALYLADCVSENEVENMGITTPLYTHPAKILTDEEVIESLAELEHEQWMTWADTIMQTEKISDNRFARWASCMIPYADLSEEMKEFDREWARKALAILRKAQEK